MKDLSQEIQKAYERWHDMNLSEEERDVAERRCKDLASIEGAKEYEHELGRQEGRQEGIEEIAKKMIKNKYKIEDIVELTGLTKEQIDKLKVDI